MSLKNSMFQKTHCPSGKRTDKIVTVFKSSGGTKRQQVKEGAYKQVNLARYKWLLIQRSENNPINGMAIQEKALDYAK